MRLFSLVRLMFVWLLLSLVAQQSFAQCTQHGGTETCVYPNEPEITSPWVYWGYGIPQEGVSTVDEAVALQIQYYQWRDSFTLVGSHRITGDVNDRYIYNTDKAIKGYLLYRITTKQYDKKRDKTYTGEVGALIRKSRTFKNWECPNGSVKAKGGPYGDAPFLCKIKKPLKDNTCPTKPSAAGGGAGGGMGAGVGHASVGNPCAITTGNKYQSATDYQSRNSRLRLSRMYNSLIDSGWTWRDEKYLKAGNLNWMSGVGHDDTTADKKALLRIDLYRGNGSTVMAFNPNNRFTSASTGWQLDKDLNLSLEYLADIARWRVTNTQTQTQEYYQLVDDNTAKLSKITYRNGDELSYLYNQSGKLSQVTDQYGQSLQYSYTGDRLTQVTLPNQKQVSYGYDATGNLTTVSKPGHGTTTYHYSEAGKVQNDNPSLLTGITDANGTRYANYAYDDQNRGILTEHAGGAQRYTMQYSESGINYYTDVTDPHGTVSSYFMQRFAGTKRIASIKKGDVYSYITNQYDSSGNIIHFKHSYRNTKAEYDALNREIKRTVVNGDNSLVTQTQWHTSLPHKTKVTQSKGDSNGNITQALRETRYTHDARGNVLTRTVKDLKTNETRTWTSSYNQLNQRTSATDPHGLTTTWVYDETDTPAKGNLLSITDAQGNTTTYANHNLDGQAQTITSPTGQVTSITYDDAGRVLTQSTTITTPVQNQPNAPSWWMNLVNWFYSLLGANSPYADVPAVINYPTSQTVTTTYEYDLVGQLTKVTLPDGEVLTYEYDDAHRLVAMTDSLGNETRYTLNAAGDITQTENKDASGVLKRKQQQVFDNLGRLHKTIGNNGQQLTHYYGWDENLYYTEDGLSRYPETNSYDLLGRKTKYRDANYGDTQYEYDVFDNITKITDPNNHATTYTINAFGETTQEVSPDSGTTTREYDKGRLTKQTDAAGRQQQYIYDAQGRLNKRLDAGNGILADYLYNDTNQLTGIHRPNQQSQLNYLYDNAGRVIAKEQVIDSQTFRTRYRYTAGGKLEQMLLPTGELIEYHYTSGTLTSVSADGKALITNISYDPNGITSYTWAQTGETVNYSHDLDGRLTNLTDPALQRSYTYDAGNRITNITDGQVNFSYSFVHDKIDRLTKQTLGNSTLDYVYDYNSNRTQKTVNTNGTNQVTNTAIDSTSNKLQDINYDPTGSVLQDGSRDYAYNAENRVRAVIKDGVFSHYQYNALGQRISKRVEGTGTQTYYVYDEQGKLIAELNQDGSRLRSYVYLGTIPVGMFTSQRPNELLQIHTDHLGTPRAVSDKDKNVLWRWEGDQFGTSTPQIQTIKLPLRHAGQYADQETGLFYNWHRYYIPELGRYNRVDDLGLYDGTNPYNYVGGNPLKYTDPTGLLSKSVQQCVCWFLKKNNYDYDMALYNTQKIRKLTQWNSVTYRPCENYLTAYTMVYNGDYNVFVTHAGVALHNFLKQSGIRKNTSPYSQEAHLAALEGATDGHNKKDWKKVCKSGCN